VSRVGRYRLTEDLEGSDGGVEEESRRGDEEDILRVERRTETRVSFVVLFPPDSYTPTLDPRLGPSLILTRSLPSFASPPYLLSISSFRDSLVRTHLEDTSQGQNQSRASSDQEDGGDVERERDGSVGGEDERSDSGDGVERLESLGEGKDAGVDDGTDGGVVVERDQRIHLEPVEEDCEGERGRGKVSEGGRREER